ncbi:MAG: hypothetical protein AAGA75_07140 [Cyanobacteria bacterium P01_E01_bin.6]
MLPIISLPSTLGWLAAFNNACAANHHFFDDIALVTNPFAVAVDLACRHALQSIPLVNLGF